MRGRRTDQRRQSFGVLRCRAREPGYPQHRARYRRFDRRAGRDSKARTATRISAVAGERGIRSRATALQAVMIRSLYHLLERAAAAKPDGVVLRMAGRT